MRRFVIFFIVFIVLVLIFLLTQLPVITGRGAAEVKHMIEETEVIALSGKTLFISDVHLISELPIESQFNLDFSDVENLIIVGDFFHSPAHFEQFGNSEEERVRNVLSQLVPRDFSSKIYFIYGETHDPVLADIDELGFDAYQFRYLGSYGKFDVDGTQVISFHGQQMHTGVIGGGLSWLSKALGYKLPLERLARKQFDIAEDTWLVTGHSHVPALHSGSKTANTGSFVGAPFNKFIFRIHIGSGILFEASQVELLEFHDLNLKNIYPFAL